MRETEVVRQVITKTVEESKKSAMQQSKPSTALTVQQAYQAFPSNTSKMLQKYPTWDDFFRIFSVNRQILICQNPKICILYPSPTLRQIDCMYGPLSAAKWLIPFIADASLSCGLKIDATKEQLQFTATAITGRYTWLKAAEMVLFFFNFKAGFYEKFYGQFDPQTIIRSMPSFLHERQQSIDAYEQELKEKEAEKDRAPSISLEEYNMKYGPTETLNRMLKSNN